MKANRSHCPQAQVSQKTANLGHQAVSPEPGTLIMFGSGILGLAGILRRKINL
jgi:hypothetical protein